MLEVFIKYGRSARHCYELARRQESRDDWEAAIPTRIDTLMHSFLGGYVDACSESILNALSQLVTLYPSLNGRQPLVTLASKHITSHLYNAVLKDDNRKFWLYFNQFWDVPQSRGSAGWLWEAHVKRQLSTGKGQRVGLGPLLSPQTPTPDPAFVDLPFSNPRTHGSQEQLAKDLLLAAQDVYKPKVCLAYSHIACRSWSPKSGTRL